jgi:solute carrier family 25 (mitochondrial citrate transporter), member 1
MRCAGGISGGIEICVSYPTEYVKTQLQLESRAASPKYTNIRECIRITYAERGIFGFYRGLSSLLYTSIPKVAARFGTYEYARNRLVDEHGKLTQTRTLLAGLCAGVSEAILVVCPAETIKVKFIDDHRRAQPRFHGFFHGVSLIAREDGV